MATNVFTGVEFGVCEDHVFAKETEYVLVDFGRKGVPVSHRDVVMRTRRFAVGLNKQFKDNFLVLRLVGNGV